MEPNGGAEPTENIWRKREKEKEEKKNQGISRARQTEANDIGLLSTATSADTKKITLRVLLSLLYCIVCKSLHSIPLTGDKYG